MIQKIYILFIAWLAGLIIASLILAALLAWATWASEGMWDDFWFLLIRLVPLAAIVLLILVVLPSDSQEYLLEEFDRLNKIKGK